MRKSRFTESQIVAILKEGDSGISIKDVVCNHGISIPTYYKWKSRYGGMDQENSKIKRMYAELALQPP